MNEPPRVKIEAEIECDNMALLDPTERSVELEGSYILLHRNEGIDRMFGRGIVLSIAILVGPSL
jgi:hypothetical protein